MIWSALALSPGQPAFGGTLRGAPDAFLLDPDEALDVLSVVLDEFVAQGEDVQLFCPHCGSDE